MKSGRGNPEVVALSPNPPAIPPVYVPPARGGVGGGWATRVGTLAVPLQLEIGYNGKFKPIAK